MQISRPISTIALRVDRRRIALRALMVLAVFALALLVRLQAVSALGTDYDEDDYLRAGQFYAQHLAAGDLLGIANERVNYEHPPLTKLAFGAVLLGYGPQAYAQPVEALPNDQLPRPQNAATVREFAQPLRTFSATVGALTAALLTLASPPAGLMLALSSWHVKYTSQAMLEALPCLFATICLLLLTRSRRNGDLRFWLAAIALGLTAAGTYRYAAGGFAAFGWIAWRAWDAPRGPAAWRRFGLPLLWGGLALLTFYAANPALWFDPIGRLRESILFNAGYSTGASVAAAGFPWFQPLFWLLGALSWNPGTAPLRLDGLFALAGLLALPALWRAGSGQRLIVLWFLANLVFLFFWPTKWPQYVLALLPAIALAAAELVRGLPARLRSSLRPEARERRELRAALPWLWPAGLLLLAVAAYPLILQIGMAMSTFQAQNIRPGQFAFWQALARGALILPPMPQNPLDYLGLGPLSTMSWIIYPLRFNLLWVATVLTLATILGLRLAVLLQRIGLRSRALWRTLFILPWAIPEFVGALIWNTIFDDNFGAVNNLFGTQIKWLSDGAPLLDLRPLVEPISQAAARIGLAPLGETLFFVVEGFSQPKAFWVLVLVGVWLCFPFMLLVSAAALRTVSDEVLEAARLDGAAGWVLWRQITWPLIAPVVLGGAILRGALLFNAFYLPQLVIGESNVERVGTIPVALIGYFAARYSDYSFAALINTIVLLIAIGLIALMLRRQDGRVGA